MLFPERACSRRPTPSSPVLGKPGGRRGSPFLRTLQGSPVRPSAAGDLRRPRPLYATLKAPEAIGPWFLSPEEWLPGAASVLSFFFPFSQAVIQSNRQTPDAPPLPGSTAGWRGRPFFLSLGPSPGRPAPGCRLAGLVSLFGPPVCLHGTPGHRPPVSFPGRLYQPVVRAPRRLYQRPGDLRPAQKASSQNREPAGGLSAS